MARRVRTKSSRQARRKKLEHELDTVNLDAAGIDIGAESIVAAVPKGRTPEGEHVRTFQSFVCSLRELANWLKACGVCTVAMESTGVYWIPLYELLEDEGFEVYLVDARKVKNVSGASQTCRMRSGCNSCIHSGYSQKPFGRNRRFAS